MDDINFEELDKAVNSALQKPSGQPSGDALLVNDAPASDVAEPDPAAPEPNSVAQPILPKRRGQFMDMVHPSSDMTTAGFSAQRPTSPSRQTTILQPLDPAIVEVTSQSASDAATPESIAEDVPTDDTSESQTSQGTEDAQRAEWPDPLDGFDKTKEEDLQNPPDVDHDALEEAAHVESSFVNDSEEGDEEVAIDNDAENAPDETTPTSPFIDGTEIEKRPLSAFAEMPKEAADDVEPEVIVPTPLPVELAPEIVSIESDNPPVPTDTEPEQVTNHQGMSASIPQQYKSAEDAIDNEQNEGHPVFDTKEYHQPLDPPVKRSTASNVGRNLLAILFVIVFGVASGYVIWAFKLL